MPKINRLPVVRKTSLGSTTAELGDFRIVLHDKRYSVNRSSNGWHRERYIHGRGWTIMDSGQYLMPVDIQQALLQALGV